MTRGEPMKGKHNRALRETRARKNGGNSGAASGADQVVESRGAFQERPASERWQGRRQCSTKTPREDLGAIASEDDGWAGSKTDAWRAGNDCDAFCSARELAKECHGSRQ